MKTVLGFISVVASGVAMMPLLVEPTPLTLWVAPAQTSASIAIRPAAEKQHGAQSVLLCSHRRLDAFPGECRARQEVAGVMQ